MTSSSVKPLLAGPGILLIGLLGGCLAPPEPTAPIGAIWRQSDASQRQDVLFVFLPGRHDAPEDFLQNGFWDKMTAEGLPADAVFVDAHLGYYYRQVLVERLTTDILKPARTMGYRQIWVVGISLGGLGAVLFDYDSPGWWDGLVLMAPFPGDREEILESVRSVDSIFAAPLLEEFPDNDYTAKFWHWMRDHLDSDTRPLYLCTGNSDRMFSDQVLIARELDEEHVLLIEGGHSWPVWSTLWSELLPRLVEEEFR